MKKLLLTPIIALIFLSACSTSKTLAGTYCRTLSEDETAAMKQHSRFIEMTPTEQEGSLESVQKCYIQINADNTFVLQSIDSSTIDREDTDGTYSSIRFGFIDLNGTYEIADSILSLTFNEDDLKTNHNILLPNILSVHLQAVKDLLCKDFFISDDYKTLTNQFDETYIKR